MESSLNQSVLPGVISWFLIKIIIIIVIIIPPVVLALADSVLRLQPQGFLLLH